MNVFAAQERAMADDVHSDPQGADSQADGQAARQVYKVDYVNSGSSLLPMLISGLVLIVVAMIVVMVFF
jgi:hypothetical protein